MTRKKKILDLIPNDTQRKVTFKKRANGLMKKVNEISVLCGVEACAIIQSPSMIEPIVWPSNLEARHTVTRFKNLSEMDRSRRMVDQLTYLSQKISKIEEQRKKEERENRKKEIKQIMFRCLAGESIEHLSLMDLNDICWMIDLTQKDINAKIVSLRNHSQP